MHSNKLVTSEPVVRARFNLCGGRKVVWPEYSICVQCWDVMLYFCCAFKNMSLSYFGTATCVYLQEFVQSLYASRSICWCLISTVTYVRSLLCIFNWDYCLLNMYFACCCIFRSVYASGSYIVRRRLCLFQMSCTCICASFILFSIFCIGTHIVCTC